MTVIIYAKDSGKPLAITIDQEAGDPALTAVSLQLNAVYFGSTDITLPAVESGGAWLVDVTEVAAGVYRAQPYWDVGAGAVTAPDMYFTLHITEVI